MRRLGSNNALLPISALLLASLMIASLVGIQGAVDSALNVTIAGRSLPEFGFGTSSMSPILTQRQPAQRASESLASAASEAPTPAVSPPVVVTVVSENASLESSFIVPRPVADIFLRTSLFEEVGSKHAKKKHAWGKKGESKGSYSASLFIDETHTVKHNVEKGSTQGKAKKK
jgi:hypothetical protein